MHDVWKKMQVKDRSSFLVLASPEEFTPVLSAAEPGWSVDRRDALSVAGDARFEVIVMFVRGEADIASAARVIDAHAAGDASLVWICYPKKSSKRYTVTISRDRGWDPVIDLGWEGVRQVAVDDDWSALRFRPREAISSYTRTTQIGRGGE